MCGINGIISKEKNKDKLIKEMNNRIIHRGPDAEGIYVDSDVALGQRRLSIIDLEGGNQPIYNKDKSILIVYNGEIYNYKELKEELKEYEFITDSDTEVILHGYEKWGSDLPNKLRGMFAYAIYDKNKNEIFISRDHFGIKPFYYYQNKDVILFGSEIKSFLAHPKFKKELNKELLGAYLTFSFTPTDETFFKNVYRLPGGYSMTIDVKKRKIKKERYYKVEFSSTKEDFTTMVNEISKTMEDSVKHHLISDVEVGSFLSSGVDSSYLVSLAKPDKTYTIGFDLAKYSEIDYAKDLTDKLNINNVSEKISKEEYMKVIGDVYYHMDEPTADGCAIAVYFLSRLASRDVKVVLSGEGADEFFGGYNSYDDNFYTKLPLGIRKMLRYICLVLPKNKITRYIIRRGYSLEESYVSINRTYYDDELKDVLKNNDYIKNSDITKNIYEEYKDYDKLNKMLAIDIRYWLSNNILTIVDKMTMAHSIESRVPFTDIEVFNVSSVLPKEYKVSDGTTKVALRTAAKKVIPNDAYKKKKLGFPVPIREWIREDDFYNEIKNTFSTDIAEELFNTEYLFRILDEHKNRVKDNYRRIWAVYSFLKWYDEYFVKR